LLFQAKPTPLQAESTAYGSEDTETIGEVQESLKVGRYFLMITICKNGELSWISSFPLPSTWHTCAFLMSEEWFLQMEIKFLSAVHRRLKPLSVSHFFYPLSASKLTCSFPLPSEQKRSIWWFLTSRWCW